jgi:GNAT superfamily N-acetyltransferase
MLLVQTRGGYILRMDAANVESDRRNIRPFRDADEAEVVGVWYRSGKAVYTLLPLGQALAFETAHTLFDGICAQCTIWVGTLGERIVAYLAMNGSRIERLYVDPSEWRKGWGTRLINLAKELSPQGLELYTHVQNHAARTFYERHGVRAVKFGTSPPPESAPDVEYHWRP